MKKSSNVGILKYIYSLIPVILFVLLLPFMEKRVPYHANINGEIDAYGSKYILLFAMIVFSLLLYYLYHNRGEKVLFLIISSIILVICSLFLLSAVIRTNNIYTGFFNYLLKSYANQVSFLMYVIMIYMFLLADIIPLNSFIGIRNSVTLQSNEVWNLIHTKAKPIMLFSAITNLYIFMLPTLQNKYKVLVTIITLIIFFITISLISHKYKKT